MTCGKKHQDNCPTDGTKVDPTEVEGRPRCRNPLCRRRLQPDGHCSRGCSQTEPPIITVLTAVEAWGEEAQEAGLLQIFRDLRRTHPADMAPLALDWAEAHGADDAPWYGPLAELVEAGAHRQQFVPQSFVVRKYVGAVNPQLRAITLRFLGGRLDATSRRKLAESEARVWGEINTRTTVVPAVDGQPLAIWYDCAGHGGYIVVADEPLPSGTPTLSHEAWGDHFGENRFYCYEFEEDSGWAIFERDHFDLVTGYLWQHPQRTRGAWMALACDWLLPLAETGDPTGEGYRAFRALRWHTIVDCLLPRQAEQIPVKFKVTPPTWPAAWKSSKREVQLEPAAQEEILLRHQAGDWGSVSLEDLAANEEALETGQGYVRSIYALEDPGVEIALVTDLASGHTTAEWISDFDWADRTAVRPETAQRPMEAAIRLYGKQKYAELEVLARRMLLYEPHRRRRVAALNLLAHAVERQGKADETVRVFEQVLGATRDRAALQGQAYDAAMSLAGRLFNRQPAKALEYARLARKIGQRSQQEVSGAEQFIEMLEAVLS